MASLVVLTEDTGADGRPTIVTLVRHMIDLVVPGTRRDLVQFLPRDEREEEAMRGAVWKTRGENALDRERRVRLLRYLARRLSQPDTFVLFHIDGDKPWKDRDESENVQKFHALREIDLPQVADRGRVHAPRGRAQPTIEPPPLHLDRLLLVAPFRSVEAWLYQNVRAAVEICRREHEGKHVDALQHWATHRGDLDELPMPDKTVCLDKDHNAELTRGFPAQEAYDVQKSFAATVNGLVQCDALTAALARARAWG